MNGILQRDRDKTGEQLQNAQQNLRLKRERIANLESECKKYDQLAQSAPDGSAQRERADESYQRCLRFLERARADLPALETAVSQAELLAFQDRYVDMLRQGDSMTAEAHEGERLLNEKIKQSEQLLREVESDRREQEALWLKISGYWSSVDGMLGSFCANHKDLDVNPDQIKTEALTKRAAERLATATNGRSGKRGVRIPIPVR